MTWRLFARRSPWGRPSVVRPSSVSRPSSRRMSGRYPRVTDTAQATRLAASHKAFMLEYGGHVYFVDRGGWASEVDAEGHAIGPTTRITRLFAGEPPPAPTPARPTRRKGG